jgi:hypothetical protein
MAQDRSSAYMTIEVVVAVMQVSLSRLLLPGMGVAAAPAAYAGTWAVALVLLLVLHRPVRPRTAGA